MRVLDLFSGIGGFSLGLERAGMRTVAFCEIDPYCRAVLAKHWPRVPVYGDVRSIPRIGCDLVSGGYPCQPFSHAGLRRGESDDRHLWPAMREVVKRERPAWVLAENVTGHITMGLDKVLTDLEGDGYACRAIVIPAAAVDAWHIRQRVYIVARDRNSDREPASPVDEEASGLRGLLADADLHAGQPRGLGDAGEGSRGRDADRSAERTAPDAPDAHDAGCGQQRGCESIQSQQPAAERGSRWSPEPGVGRVANGIPSRVDRLRALGNAVVPQVIEVLGRAIMKEAA